MMMMAHASGNEASGNGNKNSNTSSALFSCASATVPSPNGSSPSLSSVALADRLAFVLVDIDHDDNAISDEKKQQQVWWPALVFPNASEMFRELPGITTQYRAALLRDFFELCKRQSLTVGRQQVAYLIGLRIPGNNGSQFDVATRYGCQKTFFWENAAEMALKFNEYPGWCDACLIAAELSCSNSITLQQPTKIFSTQQLANNVASASATLATTDVNDRDGNSQPILKSASGPVSELADVALPSPTTKKGNLKTTGLPTSVIIPKTLGASSSVTSSPPSSGSADSNNQLSAGAAVKFPVVRITPDTTAASSHPFVKASINKRMSKRTKKTANRKNPALKLPTNASASTKDPVIETHTRSTEVEIVRDASVALIANLQEQELPSASSAVDTRNQMIAAATLVSTSLQESSNRSPIHIFATDSATSEEVVAKPFLIHKTPVPVVNTPTEPVCFVESKNDHSSDVGKSVNTHGKLDHTPGIDAIVGVIEDVAMAEAVTPQENGALSEIYDSPTTPKPESSSKKRPSHTFPTTETTTPCVTTAAVEGSGERCFQTTVPLAVENEESTLAAANDVIESNDMGDDQDSVKFSVDDDAKPPAESEQDREAFRDMAMGDWSLNLVAGISAISSASERLDGGGANDVDEEHNEDDAILQNDPMFVETPMNVDVMTIAMPEAALLNSMNNRRHQESVSTEQPEEEVRHATSQQPTSARKRALDSPGPAAATNAMSSKKKKGLMNKSQPVTPPDQYRHERIPAFEEVKKIFERAEFIFRQDLYALPGMDPQSNENAVRGMDFFTTLQDFRTNLCQYGVDNDIAWDKGDREKLKIWIRYNIVTSLKEGDKVPILEGLVDKQAWELLQKLGFSYQRGAYVKPDWRDDIKTNECSGPNQNKFRDRMRHDGLYAHLARFGFSANPAILTRDELLALELFVASGDDPTTFIRLYDGSTESLQRRSSRTITTPAKRSPRSKQSFSKQSARSFKAKSTSNEKSSPQLSETSSMDIQEESLNAFTPRVARRLLPLSASDSENSENDQTLETLDDHSPFVDGSTSTSLSTYLIKVPSFGDVRDLLESVGFVFRESLFARPGMDPMTNPSAEKGSDYFESEAEFRSHLCAYGIGVNSSLWTEQYRATLEDWVRFAIVTTLEGQSILPPHQDLVQASALALLKKLGYKWVRTYGYLVPGVDCKSSKLPQTGPCQNVFNEAAGNKRDCLFNHLARFGIQGDKSKISLLELLSLELFISSCHVESLFSKRVDGCELLTATRAGTTRGPYQSCAAEKPGSNKSAGNLSTDSNESTESYVLALPSFANGIGHSPLYNDAVADRQQPSRNFGSTVGRNITEQLNSCDDTGMTIGAKLSACLNALRVSCKLKSLSVSPNSRFHAQVSEIEKFVQNFMTCNGGDVKQTSLYVCGSPGVGKTCSVLWCCGMWFDTSHHGKRDVSNDLPLVCHLNMGHLYSDGNGTSFLLEAMAEALGTNANQVLKRLDSKSKNSRRLILVLDEIDLLVQERGPRSSARERLLENISKWINDPDLSIALIGISNSVANPRFVRLNAICKFHKKITFEPYGKQDLVKLVQDRIGTSVVDPRALEFAASKIAATTGDARQMLELTSSAVKKYMESLSDQDATGLYSGDVCLVKLGNMMAANRDTIRQHAEIVDGLPQMTKAVLCVAVTLSQKKDGQNTFTLGTLRRHCLDCLNWEEEGFGIESFRDFIQQLVDAGLLIVQGAVSEEFIYADINQLHSIPICLSLQLQDVESVLESTLEERDFYKGIINRARDLSQRL